MARLELRRPSLCLQNDHRHVHALDSLARVTELEAEAKNAQSRLEKLHTVTAGVGYLLNKNQAGLGSEVRENM